MLILEIKDGNYSILMIGLCIIAFWEKLEKTYT